MRNLRRLLAGLCCCAMLISTVLAAPVCSPWFEPELEALTEAGLLARSLQDADLKAPVTRAEVCEMVMAVWTGAGNIVPNLPDASPFTDTDEADVLYCHEMGFVGGYGGGIFGPNDPLTRQQMFCILASMLVCSGVDTTVDMNILSNYADGWSGNDWALSATALMLQLGIAGGDDLGNINPLDQLTREQALATLWRAWDLIAAQNDFYYVSDAPTAPTMPEIFEETEPEEDPVIEDEPITDPNLCSADETYNEKYTRIFGSTSASKYSSHEEAKAHMVTITVPVWNFNHEHVKVQTSRTFEVHEAIADTIMAIFTEIFNGEERFPIYSIGGYSWRGDGTSEHNWGIAIDINPTENYYVYHGVPTVGTHWTPGEDPYSIPEDGDVVRAFAKYGFAWGGNAWRYTQDYMHFSYFGG